MRSALHPVAPETGMPADVRLVRVDLDFALALGDPLFEVLSMDERATAAAFRQPPDAIRSAATRAALRQVLAAELGQSAQSLAFIRSDRGRPALAGAGRPSLDFNVSHSGNHALIAWSRRRRVGVDIEILRPDWDWRPLGRMVLGFEDARRIDATADVSQRTALFYAVWTAKEALLKAEGRGIAAGLDGLLGPVRRSSSPAGRWRGADRREPVGLRGRLAVGHCRAMRPAWPGGPHTG